MDTKLGSDFEGIKRIYIPGFLLAAARQVGGEKVKKHFKKKLHLCKIFPMKKKTTLALFIGLIFFAVCSLGFALDPKKKITQYVLDVWPDDSDLSQIIIQTMHQTRDGYLWLGSQDGLYRFDGVRLTAFNKTNTPTLKGNNIVALYQDRGGTLWIGTNSGLTRFKDGNFSFFSTLKKIPGERIRSVIEDRRGNLWIGTDKGLGCLGNGKLTVYTTKNGLTDDNIYSLSKDRQGAIWINTFEGGLNRFEDGKFSVFPINEIPPKTVINCIYEDRAGNTWISTFKGGVHRLKNGEITHYPLKNAMSKDIVIAHILEDRSGNIWLGGYNGGLVRITDGKFSVFPTSVELSKQIVSTMLEDKEGSLWLGTENGLNRLQDGKFTPYTTKEGLTSNDTRTVFEDKKGNIWMGGLNAGLTRMSDGKFTTYTTDHGLSGNSVTSISEDLDGNTWIGTMGNGITRIQNGKFTAYTTRDGLPGNIITALYTDREGNVWIGFFPHDLTRYKDGKFTPFTSKNNQSIKNVRAILQDKKGGMWFGTLLSGLFHLKDGKITNYTTKNGLHNDSILALCEDSEGTLWIGSFDGGLARLKNGKPTAYTMKHGLFKDTIYQVLDDGKGNLWMSSQKGIFTANKKELDDFAEGKISKIHCTSYDKSDGMPSNECGGGTSPAGCKTRDGKLYFPTLKGLVAVNPGNVNRNPQPPPVIIEEILVDNRSINHTPGKKIQLEPGNKNFEFHFTALSFLAPKKVKFKYLLEGFNDRWVDADTRRIAYFTNIPPGHYRFKVTACNNDGLWNTACASLDFYLPHFFYQTWWFYLLVGLLSIFAGAGFYSLRVKQLKKREVHLQRLVEERTRLLQKTNQELENLSTVVRKTENAVMIMDTESNILWVNESFLRMFEGTFEQLIFERGKDLFQISSHPDIRDIFNRCISEKKTIIYESSVETKSGKILWAQSTLTPILDKDGNVQRIVSIDSDITRVKAAEAAAEKANQHKSEFLARMSHEIRTPMSGVVGFTEMLLETELDNEQLDYVRTIHRSGEALITLLNDILDFSKIEARELSFDSIDFDPEIAAFDVCNLIIPRVGEKPVEIICQIGDNIPALVTGDAGRFRQVLVNLMGNAAKFTEKGEIHLSLEVEEETEDKIKLHAKVRDTGIGIPTDKIESIFRVFQQADTAITRKYGGTGLGLAICKEIAELMDGNVWAESKIDVGSTFHFTCWMGKSNAPHTYEAPTEFLCGKKVLLADDNAANLEILTYILKRRNLRVEAFNCPDAVIDSIKKSFSTADPFDLAIFDIQMPGISGYDLAKQIRTLDPPMSRLPLLAFSSSTLNRSNKIKETGFDAFLPKPIQRKKLIKMVEFLLGSTETPGKAVQPEEILTHRSIVEKAKHSVRILLAEDNPINRKLAQSMLSKAGYRLTIVENGKEAVDMYTAAPGQFDLIFMDLRMPEMGGIEATRIIREKGFTGIPIIALTAESMRGDRDKCLDAGMNDYIPKPIKRENVFEIVRKWFIERSI